MGDNAEDPVDHARTTRKHAGQNVKNTAAMPGLVSIGLAVLALVIGLFGFASGSTVAGTVGVVIAVALAVSGFGWLAIQRRRVRRVEVDFVAEHPEAEMQTPSS